MKYTLHFLRLLCLRIWQIQVVNIYWELNNIVII